MHTTDSMPDHEATCTRPLTPGEVAEAAPALVFAVNVIVHQGLHRLCVLPVFDCRLQQADLECLVLVARVEKRCERQSRCKFHANKTKREREQNSAGCVSGARPATPPKARLTTHFTDDLAPITPGPTTSPTISPTVAVRPTMFPTTIRGKADVRLCEPEPRGQCGRPDAIVPSLVDLATDRDAAHVLRLGRGHPGFGGVECDVVRNGLQKLTGLRAVLGLERGDLVPDLPVYDVWRRLPRAISGCRWWTCVPTCRHTR